MSAEDDVREKPTEQLLDDLEEDEGTDTEFWTRVKNNYED